MKKLLPPYKHIFNVFVYIMIFINFVNSENENENPYGAVIISGNGFHHEGLRLQETLIEKNFDVHLTKVVGDGPLNVNWEESPLVKELEATNRYKQLIFIITAHGNTKVGAQIYWTSLLKLVKILETRADEIYIHIETCFSGDAAHLWLPDLGENVKILTTSSSRGKETSYIVELIDWDLVNEIFTGYYLHENYGRPSNANVDNYKKLNCESTIFDLSKVLEVPSGKTSKRMYVHRGENESLKKWHILPMNLTIEKNDQESTDVYVPFPQCGRTFKKFDHKRTVKFSQHLKLTDHENLVNVRDPIKSWRLRTVDIPVKHKDGRPFFPEIPKEITEEKIAPYSTILAINGTSKCDVADGCTAQKGIWELKDTSELELGYYDTRPFWTLKDDSECVQKPLDWVKLGLIIGAAFVVLNVIVILIWHCFCRKKNHRCSPTLASRDVIEIRPPNKIVENIGHPNNMA